MGRRHERWGETRRWPLEDAAPSEVRVRSYGNAGA